MENKWSKVKLKNVIQFNPRECIKRGKISKKVAMERLQPFTRKISGYEEVKFTSGTKFRNGDTLLARITPCLENGKTAQVDILDKDEVGFGSTEYIVLREKIGITDNDFIYYMAISPEFRNIAIKAMNGSSGRQRVQKEVLENSEFLLPSLNEQKSIAKVLSDLDQKIEINKRINRNLYEQAITIFEQVYQTYQTAKIGDTDVFVTDYVANGSFKSLKENVTILEEKDYAYFIRNVDLKAKSFPRFVDQHSYEFLSKSKLEGGEVIISNVGDVGSVFLCPKLDGPMTLGNNMIMLKSEKHNNYLYLYFMSYIGQGMIAGITGGSAQPKFNKTDFKSLEINYPSDNEVEDFNSKVSPMLNLISCVDMENQRLQALRDTLLPKLMSGEIDVSELDI